ncbi:MMPL family transporter [Nocardia aurantiaca]|uniref:MMPL family transporter n=1 Tax=Nocardia aurantiaca TaxID=2675850 RepID=A0A6I3L4D8_9NOCA|nr:MMPL family transporter [Nocardia aurantiaca]MTE14749.1 MMPL family transporter [Nocardia aurantiaca]
MFTRWGDLVYKLRYTVLGVVVAAMLSLGAFGFGLEDHLSSSGWFDPTAQSSQAAVLKDQVYGRDHNSDVVVLYTAPDGGTVDDPTWNQKVIDSLNNLPKKYPEISQVNGSPWKTETGQQLAQAASQDRKHAFASIAIKGDNDTDMVRNYRKVKDAFYIPGVKVEVAGLQPVAGTLQDTMASDQRRMEVLALPAVAILLFFIFGGVVAAALPLIIGGLTIVAANGVIMALTKFTEVNSFVGGVVTMIGLGLAIDYGLFIVSRFREEMAEGYDTKAAVRRSIMTAGRTVTFSATMIIGAAAGMLLFPQGFLKSVAYGTIAAVALAAMSALTVLPALLSILGPRVDALGLKRFRKTKTAEEIENGYWGRLTAWVMKHPLKVAIPLTIGLLLLIIPVKNLQFGGISETYLPPDNPTRLAQEHFDETFPLRKADPVQLIIVTDNPKNIGTILNEANQARGLQPKTTFSIPQTPPNGANVWTTSRPVEKSADIKETIDDLRSMDVPDDAEVMITGTPVMMQDSIDTLVDRMPLMIVLVVFVTGLLMFLTFGSVVLPIKAALMSALGLGSTLGILTWIFIDGHGSGLLNFTPQPIMSPVLVLIISVIYGLSVDYEVFLLSRMVEARAQGASTTEAVRAGTAQTGRLITAAALILLVVTGAFAFSDLVMMQYIAYGMVAALFIDATVLRMLLVPATMKLLGDDCWWAPKWMKKIQQKIGLGEPILDDERPGGGEVVDLVKTTPITDPVTMQIPVLPDGSAAPARPRKPRPARTVDVDSEAPTQRIETVERTETTPPADTAEAAPAPESDRPASEVPSAAMRPGHGVTPSTTAVPAFVKPSGISVPESGSASSTPVEPAPASPAPAEATPPVAPRRVLSTASADAPTTDLGSGPTGLGSARGPVAPHPISDFASPAQGSTNPGGGLPQRVPESEAAPESVSHAQGGAFEASAPPPAAVPPVAPATPVPSVSQPAPPAPQAASPKPPAGPADSQPPAPVVGSGRVLPPPMPRIAPHPATRAQLAQRHSPEPEQPVESAAGEEDPTHRAVEDQPQEGGGRSSIEQWMSDLRSSRRRPPAPHADEDAKHRGGEGGQVSVNELLRRQNSD